MPCKKHQVTANTATQAIMRKTTLPETLGQNSLCFPLHHSTEKADSKKAAAAFGMPNLQHQAEISQVFQTVHL